jgi:hypothetical protein
LDWFMSIDSTVRAAVTVSVTPPLLTDCPACASEGEQGRTSGWLRARAGPLPV